MGDYFQVFFDTSDFPARWYCGNWSEFLGWLHIASDLAIFGAYFTIPAVLIFFARKRRDFPFTKLFWLFGAFIFSCGAVHLIEAIIFWHPIYRVSGAVKFLTALVSWVTVIVLIRYAPRIMHLPSVQQTNERLQAEITQRTETERELRASQQRLAAILEGTRAIVWTTDPTGAFAQPQISWERYTGQTWDEHKGFGWADAIHEDDLPAIRKRWRESLESGEKHQAAGRIWHHDSQTYRAFVAEAVPVKSESGEIVEWVGTVSDIEEQHQAEATLGLVQAELTRQKQELELIYEMAPVGMSLLDRDYRFLRINETQARINGMPREAHLGRRATEIFPDLNRQLKPIYEKVFQTREPVLDVEIVGSTSGNKDERTWLASYYPLEIGSDSSKPNEQTTMVVSAIVQDITDRKQQEIRLRESEQIALAANRSKSEFLANMSHEIRTPMAAILGYADVLLGHLKDPDNRNCLLIMKRNGEHLLDLINDILDLSRIEAGKLNVDLENVPLPQLVADIQSLMAVRAREKQVKFDVAFEGKVPRQIRTDPTRLRQVLINLIGNAIKFTDEGEVLMRVKFTENAGPTGG